MLLPDAGPRAGLGHVGRCVALAQALAARRWDVRVVVTDPAAVRFCRGNGVRTARAIPAAASVAILDSYRDPARRARSLRRAGHRVVAIDDLHQVGARDADLIVRPSAGERGSRRVVAGASHVLLRREYWRAGRPRRRAGVARVLVALGGYPPRALVDGVVVTLRLALPGVVVEVVGRVRPRERDARVRLIGHVPSLRPHLRRADLAVVAGGQTMNEALASSVPTVVLGTAENQRRNLAAVRQAGAAAVVGWTTDRGWRVRLRATALRLAAGPAVRETLAHRGHALVDGAGAPRVARAIEELG